MTQSSSSGALSFLAGGSSTGALIRSFDWSTTPLGPASGWPQPLKALVSIMLASNQPMLVAWGPQRTLVYNEPYTDVLGNKHPAALGADFLDVWHEIRETLVPIVAKAFRGEPVQMDDIHLILWRNGYAEDTHFSFFYSPVRDENGEVAGLFSGCNETTTQVRTRERVQLALDAGAIIGTWVWDATDDRFFADERFARSFGLEEEACRRGLPLATVFDSIHSEDQPRVAVAVQAALDQGGPYRCEYRVRQSDGAYRWIEANGHVERDAAGRVRFPGVLMDIEARRRAEAERDAAHALLRTVVDAVPGVVYAKDLEGRMLVANRGAAELIGKPPSFFIGRTDAEFLDDSEQARAVMATDRRVMDTGQAEQIEEAVRLPDGTPALWLSTKAPMRDAQGRVVGLIGSSVEISQRKRAEESIRESDQRKSDFLAVLSHELRNPLAPIRNGLHILERVEPASAAAMRALQVIRRQADQMARLVDDLLDMTRISRGRVELQRSRVELGELVRRAADDHHSLAEQARLRIELNVAADALWLDADPARISQVVGNLLHNAIKFTPAGGVIEMSTSRQDGHANLVIADNGIGMDAQRLAGMFEPFAQGPETLARSKGGLGLGLPLVKGLVEMHDGSVHAHSDGLGRGSAFRVRLPLAL